MNCCISYYVRINHSTVVLVRVDFILSLLIIASFNIYMQFSKIDQGFR